MTIFGRTRGLMTLAIATVLSAACTSRSSGLDAELRAVESTLAPPATLDDPSPDPTTFDGTLGAYLGYAYAQSPALRASFETWRAAAFRPDQERRLPEPTISYAVFVRSVETRVGPQRHRFSASQWFPWPTQLRAGSEAATLEARAAQRRFESHALFIAADVASAYWALWRATRQREVHQEEIELLQSLSEQVQGRVAVGTAEFSDLAQVDLELARARDRHATQLQQERVASVRLVRILGAPGGTPTPTASREPAAEPPAETADTLARVAAEHPDVRAFATLSDAAAQREREARAERAPSFGVGVDWILTGESAMTPAPGDSGKDAVALSLSVKVPLWSRAYRAAEAEARARAAAFRARAIDARNGVSADVREHVFLVEDAARRVEDYDTTLIPRATTAFESVVASYAAGRSNVAELLRAEQALLSLRGERFAALATYGTEFALLERAVGRPVPTSSTPQERPRDEG